MEITQEELFGPILPIIEYVDLDKVIDKINANPKPLALYIFDKSKGFANQIITRTSSGAVGVNLTVVHFLHPNLPFGGVNNSGIGRPMANTASRPFPMKSPCWRKSIRSRTCFSRLTRALYAASSTSWSGCLDNSRP
ncbi:aldehyde dehydrogenase [Frigidibacter mobilis]|uniref:Aldehyde dehydrogenase n=1 Tax=Frigidibacter mobilis TaxID=1335048 RepID=A0A159Z812_9RHOB|nr:aldehyde dehydrogenase family protein [Frigidibacter mobilis]AMY71571.1 aldehyde dehydrogenase [Frigidibacter mobilis]